MRVSFFLYESVSCSMDWPSLYWWMNFVVEWEIFSTKHFLALNCICQLSYHNESVLKSVCMCSTSESWRMGRYTTQSSVNKQNSSVILSKRSFINAKNKRRPRTVPWGMPDLTCTHCEWSPTTKTLCRCLVRKFEIQEWVLPVYQRFIKFVKQSVMWNFIKRLAKVHNNHVDRLMFWCLLT